MNIRELSTKEDSMTFDPKTSSALDVIASTYREMCMDYIGEVGKLGAQNNGLTLQWAATNPSARKLRKLIRDLRSDHLEDSREEKYFILRELFALKPGVHERYYYKAHDGQVLNYIRGAFSSKNTLDSKSTLFFKHILALENFYDL